MSNIGSGMGNENTTRSNRVSNSNYPKNPTRVIGTMDQRQIISYGDQLISFSQLIYPFNYTCKFLNKRAGLIGPGI